MAQQNTRPEIFSYFDTVDFLKDYFTWKKATDSKFTYTEWCKHLNLGSKTILRFILQRKRRISPRTAKSFKFNLQFNPEEEEYFDCLLSYTQPKSETERSAARLKLMSLQKRRYSQVEVDSSIATFDVYGPIILTLLTFKDFVPTLFSLSEFLQLNKERVEIIMKSFIEKNIISVEEGKYALNAEAFRIFDSPNFKSLIDFHRYWLDKAKDAFSLDYGLRRARSLKFALSESDFQQAVQKINDFAFSILSDFHTNDLNNKRLYMFESVLFPISGLFQLEQSNPKTDSKVFPPHPELAKDNGPL